MMSESQGNQNFFVPGFDLFVWAGGYWSSDGSYVGGESHAVGRVAELGFNLQNIEIVLGSALGLADNLRMCSWFPPDNPEQREDIDNEIVALKAGRYGVSVGALTLYVVRSDDPFLNGRGGAILGDVSDDDGGMEEQAVEQSSSEDESTEESEAEESEAEQPEEVEEEQLQQNEDSEEEQLEQSEDSSESDGERVVVDESKYKKFELGQAYVTIQSFKNAITKYAVKKKYDISFFKSDSKRVVAVCCNRACPWRICGTINSTSTRCVVRSFQEEHNCTWQGQVSLLNNARISDLYIEEFRVNPDFSATQLQAKLQKKNINVTWTICERTRLICLKLFDDEQAESFAKMFDYVHELRRSNPGTTAEYEIRQGVFHRFYVCFGALKTGWKAACRRIIHVDGTFLKWRMTGQLLVACGRDPNDQMFPLAWGIVDSETKDNWMWFFEHLIDDLGLEQGNGLTIMSDQCKGLIGAVTIVLPFAEHRVCARHLYHNWKKTYSGSEFEDMFWGAAKAYFIADFERKMEALKSVSQEAFEKLKLNNSCAWSRAFFTEISTCDAVENNLGESFNAAIRIARTKPVVEMLEEIRRRVLVSNETKRNESQRANGAYTPRAKALLDHQINLAKYCSPLHCGLGKYEVGYFSDRFVVHMRGEVKCACKMYITGGIPCCHIVSALRFEKKADQAPSTLISKWFTVEKLKSCYEIPMEPVNGMNMWTKTTDVRVLPPPYKRPPGRPPGKKRVREKGEAREKGKMSKVGLKMHCSNCGQQGHNKLKCKNPHVPKTKKPNGRPRKNKPIAQGSSQPPQESALPAQALEASQPSQTTSLSSALPRAKRGRPRRNWFGESSSAQEAAPLPRSQPNYNAGPIQLPREGYGVFTSPLTGDDYVSVGRRVIDTADNTILPSELYGVRERKKLATRGRGRGKRGRK